MPRRPASAPLRIALPLALCALSRLAAAQNAAFETGDVAADVAAGGTAEPAPPWRPRLSLAAGMGATFDATGFAGGTHAIPAFFAVGGFGDGLTGFDWDCSPPRLRGDSTPTPTTRSIGWRSTPLGWSVRPPAWPRATVAIVGGCCARPPPSWGWGSSATAG